MMPRTFCTFLFLLLLTPAWGQAWSGILDPSRAIDWSIAGIPGGVPSATWTQCGATLTPAPGGDDTSQISTALSSCAGLNQYVLLSAGTFTTNGSINVPGGVELRGRGPNQTIINSNSTSGTVNGYAMVLGYAVGATGSTQNFGRTTSITSTNSAGDTTITVLSATGMAVGNMVWIAPLNDWNDSCLWGTANLRPTSACVNSAALTTGGSGNGGGSAFDMDICQGCGWGQRATGQLDQITNITGTTLTLRDPLFSSFRASLPDWQPNHQYFQGMAIHPSAQPTHVYFLTTTTSSGPTPVNPCTSGSTAPVFPMANPPLNTTTVTDGTSTPQCVWQDAGPGTDSSPRLMYYVPQTNAGIQGIQFFGVNNLVWGNFQSLVYFNTCAFCWFVNSEVNRPVGFLAKSTFSYHGLIQSNYFTNSWFHGSGTDSVLDFSAGTTLFEADNNIFERTPEVAFLDTGATANVLAYNYTLGAWGANSFNAMTGIIGAHNAHGQLNLIEGNILLGATRDSIHGSNSLDTLYRNWFIGTNVICNPVSALGLSGGSLIRPAAPTVSTNAVGGTTTYNYAVEAVVGGAQSPPSVNASTTTGPATLSGTVFNTISAPSIAGTQSCLVYRTTPVPTGVSAGLIGSMACDGSSTVTDTGQAVSGLGILGTSSTFVATAPISCSPQGTFGAAGVNGWFSNAANWLTVTPAITSEMNIVGNVFGSTDLNTVATQLSLTEQRTACAICDTSCTANPPTIVCGSGARVFTSIIDESYGFMGTSSCTPGPGCYDSTLGQNTVFHCENYFNSTGVIETGNCTGSPALAHSFYLTAKPSWWGSTPFPPIGPDVTGGTAGLAGGGIGVPASFGHAYNNPAKACYETVMGGSDGSGGPFPFNPASCYAASAPVVPVTGTITGQGLIRGQGLVK